MDARNEDESVLAYGFICRLPCVAQNAETGTYNLHRCRADSRKDDKRSAMKRSGSLVCLVAIAATAVLSNAGASAQPFNPIRKLTTWYTDRSLVDIEIVGSTSMLPDLHRLQPERILKFRLERAYVHELNADQGPGSTFVHFGFDMESALPDSLFLAPNESKQFREDIPGVPKITFEEWSRRRLLVRLRSDRSVTSLKRVSDGLENCKGAVQDGDLFAYIAGRASNCRRPIHRNGTQLIARYDDDLLIYIACQEETFRGQGCKLQFPFEGFAAELAFDRAHLPRWRDLVQRATVFLKLKQYR